MQEKSQLQPEKVNDTLARFYDWVQRCDQQGVLPKISSAIGSKSCSEKKSEVSHAR